MKKFIAATSIFFSLGLSAFAWTTMKDGSIMMLDKDRTVILGIECIDKKARSIIAPIYPNSFLEGRQYNVSFRLNGERINEHWQGSRFNSIGSTDTMLPYIEAADKTVLKTAIQNIGVVEYNFTPKSQEVVDNFLENCLPANPTPESNQGGGSSGGGCFIGGLL